MVDSLSSYPDFSNHEKIHCNRPVTKIGLGIVGLSTLVALAIIPGIIGVVGMSGGGAAFTVVVVHAITPAGSIALTVIGSLGLLGTLGASCCVACVTAPGNADPNMDIGEKYIEDEISSPHLQNGPNAKEYNEKAPKYKLGATKTGTVKPNDMRSAYRACKSYEKKLDQVERRLSKITEDDEKEALYEEFFAGYAAVYTLSTCFDYEDDVSIYQETDIISDSGTLNVKPYILRQHQRAKRLDAFVKGPLAKKLLDKVLLKLCPDRSDARDIITLSKSLTIEIKAKLSLTLDES